MAEAKVYTINQAERLSNIKREVRFPPDTAKNHLFSILVNIEAQEVFSVAIVPGTYAIRILCEGLDARFGIDEVPQDENIVTVNAANLHFDINELRRGNVADGCEWEVRTLETTAKRLYIMPLDAQGTIRIEYV